MSYSDQKNLILEIIYIIVIKIKSSKSIILVQNKLNYARNFVQIYVEHIRIKSDYLK